MRGPGRRLGLALVALLCGLQATLADDVDADCTFAAIKEVAPTAAGRCAFVRTHCEAEGLVNYYDAYYCGVLGSGGGAETAKKVAMFSALAVLLLLLFRVLGTTADDYFAPALTELCREMGLPPRFAGVTFLALASGAPDISSCIVAVKNGNYLLALGGLSGAAMFVTCVVSGCVIWVGDGVRAKGALCRELIVLILATSLVVWILYSGSINHAESVLLLASYLVFSFVVLCADIWHRRQKIAPVVNRGIRRLSVSIANSAQRGFRGSEGNISAPLLVPFGNEPAQGDEAMEELSASAPERAGRGKAYLREAMMPGEEEEEDGTSTSEVDGYAELPKSPRDVPDGPASPSFGTVSIRSYDDMNFLEHLTYESQETLHSLVTHIQQEGWSWWRQESLANKAVVVFEFPFIVARVLTIPSCDEELYSKPMFTLGCFGAPWWTLLCLRGWDAAEVKPWEWAATAAASVILPLGAVKLCSKDSPPQGKLGTSFPFATAAICIADFFFAALWIQMIASELVSVITFLGSVSGINQAILGLTVIAWGNSIGDFSSNMALAKRGLGNISMTASFAGPLFNILIGLGLGFLAYLHAHGEDKAVVTLEPIIALGLGATVLNGLGMLATALACKQRIPKGYAFAAFALYAAYIVAAAVLTLSPGLV